MLELASFIFFFYYKLTIKNVIDKNNCACAEAILYNLVARELAMFLNRP